MQLDMDKLDSSLKAVLVGHKNKKVDRSS